MDQQRKKEEKKWSKQSSSRRTSLVELMPVIDLTSRSPRQETGRKRLPSSSSSSSSWAQGKGKQESKKRRSNAKARVKGKIPCELGSSCPYVSEYQHQLEFDHSAVSHVSASGTNQQHDPFSGKGHTLNNSNRGNHSSTAFKRDYTEAFANGKGYKLGKSSGTKCVEGAKIKNKVPSKQLCPLTSKTVDEPTEYVECPHCSIIFDLTTYAHHLQSHESNSKNRNENKRLTKHNYCPSTKSSLNLNKPATVNAASELIRKQDEEYEKSELEDLGKLFKEEQLMPRNKEIIDIDTGESTSPSFYSCEDKNLGRTMCETQASQIILAFRIKESAPAGCVAKQPKKVIKKFYSDSTIQVCIFYCCYIAFKLTRDIRMYLIYWNWTTRRAIELGYGN